MGPSQVGSLKGLIGTRDTRVYTSSAPYDEGESLRLVVMELLGFQLPGSKHAMPGFRVVVSRP